MAGGQALPGVQGLQLPASAWVETRSGTRVGTAMGTGAGKGMEGVWMDRLHPAGRPSSSAQLEKRRRWHWGLAALSAVSTLAVFTDSARRYVSPDKRILSLTYL